MTEKPFYRIERQHRATTSEVWWPVAKVFESKLEADEWIRVQASEFDKSAYEYDYRILKIWAVVTKSQIL